MFKESHRIVAQSLKRPLLLNGLEAQQKITLLIFAGLNHLQQLPWRRWRRRGKTTFRSGSSRQLSDKAAIRRPCWQLLVKAAIRRPGGQLPD
jgi:hypothetical protein